MFYVVTNLGRVTTKSVSLTSLTICIVKRVTINSVSQIIPF